VSRCIVDALQQACHLYDESLAKLTVLTDATNQKISLTKHLARECNVEVCGSDPFLCILSNDLFSIPFIFIFALFLFCTFCFVTVPFKCTSKST